MHVLWYVNVVMPAAAAALGLPQVNIGGWLTGAAEALQGSEIDFTIATVTPLAKKWTTADVDGIRYILLPQKHAQKLLPQMLTQENPDLVHIFGTEYSYNTQLIHLCAHGGIHHVVSLQGIMYQCAHHYDDGLPERFRRINPAIWLMRKLYYADSIALEKRRFAQQGELEKSALQAAEAVIGRTAWDRQCALEINPNLRYYCVNENLRAPFYTPECWQYQNCVPHSIFVSQSFYPIKGFHMLLKAMPELIKRYQDIRIVVGGQKPYSLHNPILDMGVDYFFEYQRYIKKLIKEQGLSDYIHYTGSLTAEQMKQQYLRCNVFLSCASIENSPNSVGEAMMLGTPIVASDVGGTSSMLKNGEDGILYDFFSTQEVLDGISTMFDQPETAAQMGRNANHHAHQTHDRQKNTEALLKVYRDVTSKSV